MLTRAVTLLAGLAVLAPAGRAAANGAFPDSDAVLLPADRPQQIVLGTNFGLILSDDGGTTWQWSCERAETSMASAYALGAPPGDRLYSRSLDVGLGVSDDESCSWHRAGGALASAIATDYFPDPTDAAHVLAIAGGAVIESTDGGDSFAATPLYVAPAGAELLGVEIARGDPRIIYLTMATPGPHPVLARSDDAGAHWATFDIEPSIGARSARIIAVDPVDANVIYLRVAGPGVEVLAVSRDGGMTLRDPAHRDGRRAERVRAPRERHRAGGRPGSGRGRHHDRRGLALQRRRPDVRRLDAGADAAAARARRARGHALPGGQQLHGRLGAGAVERRGSDDPADHALRPGRRREGVRGRRLPGAVRRAGGPQDLGARGVQPVPGRRRPGRGPAAEAFGWRVRLQHGSARRWNRRRRAAARAGYGGAKCGETATPRKTRFDAEIATAVPVGVLVPLSTNTTSRFSVSAVVAINVTVPPVA